MSKINHVFTNNKSNIQMTIYKRQFATTSGVIPLVQVGITPDVSYCNMLEGKIQRCCLLTHTIGYL